MDVLPAVAARLHFRAGCRHAVSARGAVGAIELDVPHERVRVCARAESVSDRCPGGRIERRLVA
eukprot:5904094-Prymnesium_polylepis.1